MSDGRVDRERCDDQQQWDPRDDRPRVDGGAAADLDGDGREDIVWRNQSTGENAAWLMVELAPDGGAIREEHVAPVRYLAEHRAGPEEQGTTGSAQLASSFESNETQGSRDDLTLRELVDETELEAIRKALIRARGNKSEAARSLGITRNGLTMKIPPPAEAGG